MLLRDTETHPPSSILLAELADEPMPTGTILPVRASTTPRRCGANPGNERARRKLLDMGVDVAALIPEFVVAPDALADYPGRYRLAGGAVATIRQVQDATLELQVTGLGDMKLVPISADVFSLENTDDQLTFSRDATGKVDSLTWLQSGRGAPATKIE